MLFSREYIEEIGLTLKRNKLRTFLTGFAVAWGVLFLILLLGVGAGVRSGVIYNIGQNASINDIVTASLWWTSMPYKGLDEQSISLTESEWQRIQEGIPEIKKLYMSKEEWRSVSADGYSSTSSKIVGMNPRYAHEMKKQTMLYGRAINEIDNRLLEKNTVLSNNLAKKIFGREDVLGEYLTTPFGRFLIVGVFLSSANYECHIPESVYDRLSPSKILTFNSVHMYCPDIRSDQELEDLRMRIFAKVRLMRPIHPDDDRVVYITSTLSERRSVDKVLNGLDLFLWAMGLSTLLVGIVGVSNIMLVTVRERMREIGIRKALGAKRVHIISMIMTESIIVTLVSGLIGLVVGVGVLVGIEQFLLTTGMGQKTIEGESFFIFRDPIILPSVAFMTVLVMVVAGAIAGFVPTRRAVRVPAVEAMRE